MLTCRTLRGAVLTSGVLLLTAWLAELLAHLGVLPGISVYFGLILLLAAIGLLGVTLLLSLLPANTARLSGCEH